MPVSVIQPRARAREPQQRPKEKLDFLDIILKGLQVAEGVTGTVANIEQLGAEKQKMKLREAQISQAEQKSKLGEMALAKQQTALEEEAFRKEGILPQRDILALQTQGKQVKDVSAQTPGAISALGSQREQVIDEATGEVIGSRPTRRFVQITDPGMKLKERQAQATMALARSTKEAKSQKEIDAGAQKLSKQFDNTGVPEILPIMERIDNQLISLGLDQGMDTLNPKIDVPGFGRLAGSLPDIAISRGGQDLRQDVNSLVNILLKARSGGAVTPQEAGRLAAEIKGADTDRALLRGLKNLKDTLRVKMQNSIAGVSKQSLDAYKERSGINIDSPIFAKRIQGQAIADSDQQTRRSQSPKVGAANILDNLIESREKVGQVDQPRFR